MAELERIHDQAAGQLRRGRADHGGVGLAVRSAITTAITACQYTSADEFGKVVD